MSTTSSHIFIFGFCGIELASSQKEKKMMLKKTWAKLFALQVRLADNKMTMDGNKCLEGMFPKEIRGIPKLMDTKILLTLWPLRVTRI